MPYIESKKYLDRLKGLRNTPDIKIITGLRRSGKSELMRTYIRYLKEIDPRANIIYIDYYDLDFDGLKEYRALHAYVKERYGEGKNNYLFIDEIQLCPNFELAVNSLHNSKNFDIYITGSNAFLLSSDLTTLFTGRFIEIPVYPFSFSEFCTYHDTGADIRAYLKNMFKRADLPALTRTAPKKTGLPISGTYIPPLSTGISLTNINSRIRQY